MLSASLADFILMNIARICRSEKESGEYEMRSETTSIEREA